MCFKKFCKIFTRFFQDFHVFFPFSFCHQKRRKKMKIGPTANPSWCFTVGHSVKQDVLVSFLLICFILFLFTYFFLVNLFKKSFNLWFDEGKNLRCKTSSQKNPQRLNMLLKKKFKYFALQVGIFVSFYKMFIFFIFILKRFRQNAK